MYGEQLALQVWICGLNLRENLALLGVFAILRLSI